MVSGRTSSLIGLSLLVAVWSLVATTGARAQYTLAGFGNDDTNAEACSAMGVGGATCSSAGSCSVCALTSLLDNVSVACTGESHSVAVLANGSIAVTGLDLLLGNGMAVSATTCTIDWVVLQDWDVTNMDNASVRIIDAQCSANYTMLLADNGTVYAFGVNHGGAFGEDATTLDHFATPTPIDVTGSADVTVTGIGAGYEAAVFMLTNGSVFVTGSGAIRSSATAVTGVTPVAADMPTCTPRLLAVGLETAVVLCDDNTTLVGWGSNSRNQLVNSTDNTTSIADVSTDLFLGSGSSEYIETVSVSATHLLVLLSNGTVLGRGSNSDGQLGLGASTSQADEFLTVDFANAPPASPVISGVSAGRGYSAMTTAVHTIVAGGSYTNVFVTGSNAACALGLGDSSLGLATELTAVPIARLTYMRAAAVLAGEFRRTMVLLSSVGTASESMTVTDTAATNSMSTTRSRRTITDSLPVTVSDSRNTESKSESVTYSEALSLTPTKATLSSSTSHELTDTPAITESHTSTIAIAPAPQIQEAVFDAVNSVLYIYFDVDTNLFGAANPSDRIWTVDSTTVRSMFRITGGNVTATLSQGTWLTRRQFSCIVTLDSARFVYGQARLELLESAIIMQHNVTSSRTPAGFSLTIIEPQASVEANRDNETGGLATWIIVLLAVVCGTIVVVYIVVFVVAIFKRRRDRAVKEEEERRAEEQKRRMRHASHAVAVEVDGEVEDPQEAKRREAERKEREAIPTAESLKHLRTMYGRDSSVERERSKGVEQQSPPRTGRSGMMVDVPVADGDSPNRSATRRRPLQPPTVQELSPGRPEQTVVPSWTARREFEDDPPLPNYGYESRETAPTSPYGGQQTSHRRAPPAGAYGASASAPEQYTYRRRVPNASQVARNIDFAGDDPYGYGYEDTSAPRPLRVDVEQQRLDATPSGAAARRQPDYASGDSAASASPAREPRVFRFDPNYHPPTGGRDRAPYN